MNIDLALVVSLLTVVTSSLTVFHFVSRLQAQNSARYKSIQRNTEKINQLANLFHMYLMFRSGKSSTLNERSIDKFLTEQFDLED